MLWGIFERYILMRIAYDNLFLKFGKRRGPKDPEIPSYEFLRISNMGSISSRKYELALLGYLKYGIKILKKNMKWLFLKTLNVGSISSKT